MNKELERMWKEGNEWDLIVSFISIEIDEICVLMELCYGNGGDFDWFGIDLLGIGS